MDIPTVERTLVSASHGVSIRQPVPLPEMATFLTDAFREFGDVARSSGAWSTGSPFARVRRVPHDIVDVEAVLPISARVATTGRVRTLELDAGTALQILHLAPWHMMTSLHAEIARFLLTHELSASEPMREVFVTNPATHGDPSLWQSFIVQPVRPR